jgi:hypothetical protein
MSQSNHQRNPRPGTGDLTGRLKAAQAHEQREALRDRESEIAMRNAVEADEEENGVFDAQTGARIGGAREAVEVVDLDAVQTGGAEPFFQRGDDDEPVLSGKESPDVLMALGDAQRRPRRPERVLSAMVEFRVDQDVDDMTYGMLNGEPNNLTFKEGRRYRTSRDVYEHLLERGLIRQVY